MPSVSSDDNKIIVEKGVVFSKSNDFIPVIRALDTKHDFEDYYNVKNIYSHYFSKPEIMVNKISKLKLEKSISTGANSLHPIVDFKTNVESNQDWKLTTSKNLDYTVKMPNIIGPVKITDIYDDSSLNDFYNLLPVERDVLIYLQGKKVDFYENPKGINALQKLMGVTNTNNSPTFVSKDTFPFSTDKVKKIFNVAANSNFKCYTTEIMDPATESKDILKNSKSINFKLVFCYLNNKPIYINITKAEKSEKISITFSRSDSNNESSTFDMNSKIKTPSVLDVVIQIYIYKNKKMKTMGAKILKALKKTGANESTKNMQDNYFNPIVNCIQELYEEPLIMGEKEVIAIASKTIGDQMYLFDAVGYEHKNRTELNNINGTFVVSIDTFLNDYIKHTKSCNSFQASKFGKKIPRTPSNYEVCIYLKPLPEEARKQIEKEQEKANKSLINNIEKKKTEIKAGELKELSDSYNNFLQKAVTIYAKIFEEFTPVGNGRIVKEFTNKELDGGNISSTKVSEMYYTACYTLQNIIQFYYLLNATNQKYNDLIKPSTGNQNTQDLKNLYNGLNYCTAVFNDAKKFIEDMKLDEDPTKMKSTLNDKLENDELVDKLKLSTPGLESVRMSLDKNALYVARLYKIKIPSTVPIKNCFTKVQKYIVGYFNQYKDLTNRKVSGGGNDKVDIKSTIEDDIKFILENGEDTDMIAELFDLLHYFHYRDIYEQTNTDENDNFFEDISTIILDSIKIENIHLSHVNFVTKINNIKIETDAYFNSQNSNVNKSKSSTKSSTKNFKSQNSNTSINDIDERLDGHLLNPFPNRKRKNSDANHKSVNNKTRRISKGNKSNMINNTSRRMDTIKLVNRHWVEINGKKIPLYKLPHNKRKALAENKNKTILVPRNHTKTMETIRKSSGFGHASKKRISRSQRKSLKSYR